MILQSPSNENLHRSDCMCCMFLDVEPFACKTFVFTRIIYLNGQNNECLSGYRDSSILFGFSKMHFLPTSANFDEVI